MGKSLYCFQSIKFTPEKTGIASGNRTVAVSSGYRKCVPACVGLYLGPGSMIDKKLRRDIMQAVRWVSQDRKASRYEQGVTKIGVKQGADSFEVTLSEKK